MEKQHNITVGTIIEPDQSKCSIAVLDRVKGYTRLVPNTITGKYEAVTWETVGGNQYNPISGLICFLDIIPSFLEGKNRLKVVVVEAHKVYARVIP